MRPYPNDIPQNPTSEASWDFKKASEHLSRVQNSSVDESKIANASSISDLVGIFNEWSSNLEDEAIESALSVAVENFVANNKDDAQAIVEGEASLSEQNDAVQTIQAEVPRDYQYETKVKDEDGIIDRIKAEYNNQF